MHTFSFICVICSLIVLYDLPQYFQKSIFRMISFFLEQEELELFVENNRVGFEHRNKKWVEYMVFNRK